MTMIPTAAFLLAFSLAAQAQDQAGAAPINAVALKACQQAFLNDAPVDAKAAAADARLVNLIAQIRYVQGGRPPDKDAQAFEYEVRAAARNLLLGSEDTDAAVALYLKTGRWNAGASPGLAQHPAVAELADTARIYQAEYLKLAGSTISEEEKAQIKKRIDSRLSVSWRAAQPESIPGGSGRKDDPNASQGGTFKPKQTFKTTVVPPLKKDDEEAKKKQAEREAEEALVDRYLQKADLMELKSEKLIRDLARGIIAEKKNLGGSLEPTIGDVYKMRGQTSAYFRAHHQDLEKYVPEGWRTGVKRSLFDLSCDVALAADAAGEALFSNKPLPNSYGITVTIGGSVERIREVDQARAFFAKAREKSVNKVIFYGHGAPGSMQIGASDSGFLEVTGIAGMLDKKMAAGGEAHLIGCNTSSVPDETRINPGKGLSYLIRRILYYSVPRAVDTIEGVPAKQSRETLDEMWNDNLAQSVSAKLPGVKVIGLRTFGLVPGRLWGQDTIEPGMVLGERACYLNGRTCP